MYVEPSLMTAALQTLVKKGLVAFRRENFFKNERATPEFLDMVNNFGVLSSGEQVFVLALLDLWNGQGNAKFNEFYSIDYQVRERIFSLYQALSLGETAVRAWIARETK